MDPDTDIDLRFFDNYLGVAAVNLVPESCTAFGAQIFGSAIDAGLRRHGVEPGQHTLLFDSHFIVWISSVDQVKLGLRAVHQTIGEMRLLEKCLVEIAHWDQHEQFWRTVYPRNAQPFDRFLKTELLLAAKAKWEQYGEFMRLLKSFVEQQTRPGWE